MDIKYAYYNTSKGYRVLGGTAAQFLKADGSIDSKEYIDKYSEQNIEGDKWFRSAGGNQYLNHRLRIISEDGSNPGLVFYKSGVNVGTIQYNGVNYLFTNSDTNAFSNLVSAGYIKEGSNNNFLLLGGGGHVPITEFVTNTDLNTQLSFYHKIDFTDSINNGSSTRTNKSWFDYDFAGTGQRGSLINFSGLLGLYSTELFGSYDNPNAIAIRTKNGDTNSWNAPRWLWHDKNLNKDEFVASKIINGSYNANNLSTNSITYGYNVANAPTSASSHSFTTLNLDTTNPDFKMQIGFDGDTNEMFSRTKSGGNWYDWVKYATTSQLGNYVTRDTDQSIDGKKTFNTFYDSYTPDGLFDSNARTLKVNTPSGQKILFGYKDYGGGQYYPRIGFTNDASLTKWSLGPSGNNFVIGINNDGVETFRIHPSGATSNMGSNTQVFQRVYQSAYPDTSHHTGMLVFKMPQASPDQCMFSIDINIYGYESQYLGKINVSFYKYVSGLIISNGSKALFNVTENFPTNVARVGIGTDGLVSIILGQPNTFWNNYTSFEVERVQTHYANYSQDWSQGWSHALETDLSQYGSNIITLPTDVTATKEFVNQNLSEYWKKYSIAGYTGINAPTPFGFLNGNVAQKAYMGGLLVSDAFQDEGNIPTNGIYSNGDIISNNNIKAKYFNGNGFTSNQLNGTQVFACGNDTLYIGNTAGLQYINFETGGNDLKHFRTDLGYGVIWDAHNFNPDLKVSKSGDTMTGSLIVNSPDSIGSNNLGVLPQNTKLFLANGNTLVANYGTVFWTEATGQGFIQQQRADGYQQAYDLRLQPLGGGLFYGNNEVATVNQFQNYYTKNESLNLFVGLNGVQTIYDTKTFNSSPIIPNGTLGNHAVNLNQLNNKVTNIDSVKGVAFDSGLPTGVPYFIHTNGTYIPIATQSWVSSNYISTSHIANTITLTNIQQWNYMAQYGLQLNSDFTVNTGSGLLIADDYFGGESGMIDRSYDRFVSAKQEGYYKYGSRYGTFDGLNFNFQSRLFGMGRESNKEDKLTVEGSVKASKNFKSEEERPDTIFIPNGNVASLKDEIVNDESEYAIRLDPHEYEIDPSGYLDVDDRNRLIHIIGEQVKMVVNFKEIYPKQQIVIYNFDKSGGAMTVKIYGKDIYNIEPGSFLRLYVTRSRRVIAERQLPCEFVW